MHLAVADYCVSNRKANGGLYGHSAILLLSCVVEALSNFAGHPKHSLGAIGSIFPGLTDDQVRDIKNWYRNLPAHQAIIMPGTQLSDDPDGNPIEFNSDGEPTHVRVIPFYQAVKRGWEAFDKNQINPKFEPEQAPKTSVIASLSSPSITGSNNIGTGTTAKPK